MRVDSHVEGLVGSLREHGVLFEDGLTDEEIAGVEATYGFRFPPDLKALLQHALPMSTGFPNWRDGPEASLRERLAWPAEGLYFDVEHNVFWMEEWGSRPQDLSKALEIAAREVAKAPTLIPVYGHRYIAVEPHLAGNPVLSVYQTDIIYYGSDLAHYFENEFLSPGRALPGYDAVRKIRFWSQIVEL
jgi:hypothetical protein